jgi:hypothetical protein
MRIAFLSGSVRKPGQFYPGSDLRKSVGAAPAAQVSDASSVRTRSTSWSVL